MAIKLQGVVYAHSDGTLTVTPREGSNAGIPFECRAVKSWEVKSGASYVHLPGLRVGPEGIAPTEAKPTWTAELSKASESIALTKHLGPGAVTVPCDVSLTLQRKGQPTVTYTCEESLITDGLGDIKSDSGSAPSGNIGGGCVDLLIDGVSLLNRPPAATE